MEQILHRPIGGHRRHGPKHHLTDVAADCGVRVDVFDQVPGTGLPSALIGRGIAVKLEVGEVRAAAGERSAVEHAVLAEAYATDAAVISETAVLDFLYA